MKNRTKNIQSLLNVFQAIENVKLDATQKDAELVRIGIEPKRLVADGLKRIGLFGNKDAMQNQTANHYLPLAAADDYEGDQPRKIGRKKKK